MEHSLLILYLVLKQVAIYTYTITQTAYRKCHGLVVLKRAGINASSLVVLYQSQIRPIGTYSAAAWYPYTTGTQQKQLEMTQKLALRIIFPD